MSDILRIALAETDDLAAYHVQGQLRKLERPFSLRRIADQDALIIETVRFGPDVIIFDEEFAPVDFFERMRDKSTAPVIVLRHLDDRCAAPKMRQRGADSFIYFSGLTDLPLLVEKTLSKPRTTGGLWNPYYRSEPASRTSISS